MTSIKFKKHNWSRKWKENGINYNLFNVQTSKPSISVWRRNEKSCSLTRTLMKVLKFWKLPCSTPNHTHKNLKNISYSHYCQAVILRPTNFLLGLVFQSVAEKQQLLICIKHEQKCNNINQSKHQVNPSCHIDAG